MPITPSVLLTVGEMLDRLGPVRLGRFSLLTGTNRLKIDADIVAAAVQGLDAIKPKPDELKAGVMVFMRDKRLAAGPPKDQADLVREHCRKIGLQVQRLSRHE
jgi:hypothetical protein